MWFHESWTKDHYAKFGNIFQESIDKKKFQVCSKCASNSRNRFLWKPVLQKGTSSCCVLFIHKASKHDHVIYSGVIQCHKSTNLKIDIPDKLEFSAFTNSRKAETSSHERRLINKSFDTFLFLYFISPRNNSSHSNKVADQGQHKLTVHARAKY